MRAKLQGLIATTAFVLLVGQPSAQPSPPPPEAYEFAIASIRSLTLLIDAADLLVLWQNNADRTENSLAQITSRRRAAVRAKEASLVIAPFTGSSDSSIAAGSKAMALACATTVEVYSRSAGLFERLLKAKSKEELDEIGITSANIAAELREAERIFFLSIPSVPIALVDMARADAKGQMSFLRITQSERTELIKSLRNLVGPKPADESVDKERGSLTMAAVTLWRWLHQPGYQAASDR